MADDLRSWYADAIRQAADYSITAEWICCDPIHSEHELCVKGDIARQMLRAVLADDSGVLAVPSKLMDAVMAVRDDDLETARAEAADLADLITSERAIHEATIARAEQAEAAIARVRRWAEKMREQSAGEGLGAHIHATVVKLLDVPESR